mmetsp:Transcript_25282/g.41991  ORF Transcript_25282/g.41991 Transcript_25282/m.41991 type:complete len:317 (+) Transcript_25282:226-1176(+)
MMIRNTALFLLLTASTSSAFMIVGPSSASASASTTASRFVAVPTVLFADNGEPLSPEEGVIIDGEANVNAAASASASAGVGFGETAAPAVEEEEVVAEEEPVVVAAEEEVAEEPAVVEEEETVDDEPKEDPAVTAIKEEIANAASDLKGKKATLSRIQDDVDKYTESGYSRRVAQMEDMKRIRMTMQSSNKETAVAGVVQNFLPVMDDLQLLKTELDGDDFGAKYAGMAGNLMGALKELGVEEFSAEIGDVVNAQRMTVVDEEVSTDGSVAKGSILRPVSAGMELAGNVMRMAQVVTSLGSADEQSKEGATEVDVE